MCCECGIYSQCKCLINGDWKWIMWPGLKVQGKMFFSPVLEGISVFRWVILKCWFVSWPPGGLVKNTRVSDLAVLGGGSRICISASSQVIQVLQVQGPHTENHYPSLESRAHFIPRGSGGVMALPASQLHYVKVIDGLNSGFSSSSILPISVSSTFLRNKYNLEFSAEPVTFLSMLIQKLMMKSYFYVLDCRMISKDDFWESWTVFWGQSATILVLILNRSFLSFFLSFFFYNQIWAA